MTAKLNLFLLRDLVVRYTRPGDVLLDPFGGIGTLLLATTLPGPRDVILVELEARFARWAWQNAAHLRRYTLSGVPRGRVLVIQGDSRHLPLRSADSCISSPPYADVAQRHRSTEPTAQRPEYARYGKADPSRQVDGYSHDSRNLGNLPRGDLAATISSPPYAGVVQRDHSTEPYEQSHPERARYAQLDAYSANRRNLGNLPRGAVAAAVSSPPYARTLYEMRDETRKERDLAARIAAGIVPDKGQCYGRGTSFVGYGQSTTNLGNLPEQDDGEAETYWSAMRQVLAEIRRGIIPGGLLVLVVGDYVRDGKLIPLGDDTVKLAEAVGWTPVERWLARKPALSFWRILAARRKLPLVAAEHVLVFAKGEPAWDFQELPPTTRAPARLPDADALIEAAQQLALFDPPRP